MHTYAHHAQKVNVFFFLQLLVTLQYNRCRISPWCCLCERSGSSCPERWHIARCHLDPRLGRWLLLWRWWHQLCLVPRLTLWRTPPQETQGRYRSHPQCEHRLWLRSVWQTKRHEKTWPAVSTIYGLLCKTTDSMWFTSSTQFQLGLQMWTDLIL